MAKITITLSDTPDGGVSVHTDFKPAIGQPCTPAQGHALEIINRTHKQWGLHISREAIISDDLASLTDQAAAAGQDAVRILGRTA